MFHEMCHGVQGTMKAIEYFLKKGKIFSVHFRDPRGGIPHGYCREDFLDEGDLDMLEVMCLFRQYETMQAL